MATINLTQRNDVTNPNSQVEGSYPVKKRTLIFDAAAGTLTKGSALAANDVAQLINIKAGTFVLAVSYKVLAVEGGTFTFSVGDGASTAGYASAINGNTLAEGVSFNATTTPALGVGKYYSADDTIDLLVASGAPAKARVAVTVAYFNMNPAGV